MYGFGRRRALPAQRATRRGPDCLGSDFDLARAAGRILAGGDRPRKAMACPTAGFSDFKERSELRSDAQGGAFLENRRGAGNLARSRLSGGSWAMSEPSWPAQGRLKAGCSQDWLPHKAVPIFIIRCDAARVMSNLCHFHSPTKMAPSSTRSEEHTSELQ